MGVGGGVDGWWPRLLWGCKNLEEGLCWEEIGHFLIDEGSTKPTQP